MTTESSLRTTVLVEQLRWMAAQLEDGLIEVTNYKYERDSGVYFEQVRPWAPFESSRLFALEVQWREVPLADPLRSSTFEKG